MKSTIRITNKGNTIRATGAVANDIFKALTGQMKDEAAARIQKLSAPHQRAVQYIKNGGNSLTKIATFDDDHEPIGPTLRREMKALGIIQEHAGIVFLTPQYEA